MTTTMVTFLGNLSEYLNKLIAMGLTIAVGAFLIGPVFSSGG